MTPTQSQTALTQSSGHHRPPSSDYLDPSRDDRDHRHHHRRHSSRSGGRERSSHRDRNRDHSRPRSHSRTKEYGATAAGGAAGAWLGHEIGHGKIGTLAGLAVGALGARELEKRYEKHSDRKQRELGGDGEYDDRGSYGHRGDRDRERERDRDRGGDGRPRRRERRKSFVEQAQDKIQGFLNPDEGRGAERRSRSHVGASTAGGGHGSRRKSRAYDSESSDSYDDRYERRGAKGGGRSRRDDY